MVKKYVKGRPSNPEGVIEALENLGGVNTHHYSGDIPTSVYYIDNSGSIFRAAEDSALAEVILECFEEIRPTPKAITNIDLAKWYFHMLREGHAVQFMYNGQTFNHLLGYYRDGDKTDFTEVRIDFGEWIPIEETDIV